MLIIIITSNHTVYVSSNIHVKIQVKIIIMIISHLRLNKIGVNESTSLLKQKPLTLSV